MEYKVIVDMQGTIRWYKSGTTILHREDGPAVERADGTKYWYRDGKCHREDGPAIEDANGDKSWYRDGKYHREDGPAVEYADDGEKYWYLDGVELTEYQWKAKMASRTPSCDGKTVTIDGVVYTLTKV